MKRNRIIRGIEGHLFLMWVSLSKLIVFDRLWLRVYYRLAMHEKLSFNNPRNYTQKIQVLKLRNTNPLYTQLVDKYGVREYIKEHIGENYLIPLHGVYKHFDDIDFNALPDCFVLKTTHDSGSVVICHDKNTFDYLNAKKKLESSLKRNYYWKSRETPYKNVIPQIIVEQYMSDKSSDDLPDYKFYCFDGEPIYLSITSGRHASKTYCDFFDMDFNHLEIRSFFDNNPITPLKPENFEEMKNVVRKLSIGIKHVRVDLYNINGSIYFGEFTFHDSGGLRVFESNMGRTHYFII